jgi:hypothetical protein
MFLQYVATDFQNFVNFSKGNRIEIVKKLSC